MKFSTKILFLTFTLVTVLMLSVVASADTTLVAAPVEIEQGTTTVDVLVSISSDDGVIGAGNIEAYLPDGWGYSAISYSNVALSDLTGIAVNAVYFASENFVNIVWDSQTEDPSEKDGDFFTLTLTVPADAEGEYEITFETVEMYVTADWLDIYPELNAVVTVNAAAPAATLEATGKSLLLDGGIDAKVYFAYNGTDTLKINGVAAASDAKGYYGYVSVSPKDYADTVTFTATASDVDDVVVTTSVAAIIDEYQATATGTLKTLVDALEVYCAQANAYFNGGSADAVSATVSAATPAIDNKAIADIAFDSTSLILRDKVVLRHYFDVVEDADLSGYGETLVAVDATHAYVEYANINAADLGNVITTTLTKGGETMTINFAPLAYAALTQNDAEIGNLVKALYLYSVAAAAYAA